MTQVQFLLKDLESVAPIRAKGNELRRNITGVYFDSDNGVIVATNGHILAKVDANFQESFKSFTIDGESVDKIVKLGKAFSKLHKIPRLALDIDTEQKMCRIGEDTISVNIIEDSYIDFMRVFPKEEDANQVPCIGINAEYLLLLQDSMRIYYESGKHSTAAIRINFNGAESPMVLQSYKAMESGWVGLIMPIKLDV